MKTFIDTITIVIVDDQEMGWVDDFHRIFGEVGPLTLEMRKFGRNRYDNGAHFEIDGAVFAEVDWGGAQQRNTVCINIKGQGCAMVKDWAFIEQRLLELAHCRISRIDIALDLFNGSLTIEDAWACRKDRSLWVSGKGGRPPQFTPVGHPEIRDDNGRTLYIGSRGGDVFQRLYEKGLQLFAGLRGSDRVENKRDAVMQLDVLSAPFKVGDYVRLEAELRAKTTVIPITALTNPDGLFAGVSPFNHMLLGKAVTPVKRLRVEHQVMTDIDAILQQIQRQYGPSLVVAREKFGQEEMLRRIMSVYPSKTLTARGANMATVADLPRVVDQSTGEVV